MIGRPRSFERTRVGELLTNLGVIRQSQLDEALVLAKRTASPVGRILSMTGSLKEPDLQLVLQAQQMMRGGQVAYETGMKALYIARRSRVTYEEALSLAGWQSEAESELGQLAEILLSAEVISEQQVKSARVRSQHMNLPLGRTLVLMGLVSPSIMAAALNAQVLLKQKEINLQEAIYGVKIAAARRMSLEKALILEGICRPRSETWVKLGELFAIAGLLSESDGLWAVEEGLNDGRPLGQILIEHGLVSPDDCKNALELQQMVADGQLSAPQAAELLKEINNTGISATTALQQLNLIGFQVAKLLIMAGIVSEEDVQQAQEQTVLPVADLSVCIFDAGLVDVHALDSARQCLGLIRDEKLKVEQAVVVLSYCVRSKIGVAETLQELAWDQVADPANNFNNQHMKVDEPLD